MQLDSVLLYESPNQDNIFPFSALHPIWELRVGAFRLFERIKGYHPNAKILFQGRQGQLKSFLKRFDIENQTIEKGNILITHGGILAGSEFWKEMDEKYSKYLDSKPQSLSVTFTKNNVPAAVFLHKDEQINPNKHDLTFLPRLLIEFWGTLPIVELDNVEGVSKIWEIIDINGKYIEDDSILFDNKVNIDDITNNGVHLINSSRIIIGQNCQISPGVVIDASDGVVIIDDNVKIMAQSTIIGPCYIGKNTIVKVGAKIYHDTSIGEYCKVGGEIECSIIQSYSNKQHEGFLGHSFLSEWVNLGADTNTSDLKNTYGKINLKIGKREVDTGKMFLGLICGDHTKSAINSMFTTGTVAGICGVLLGNGFMPNYIPSFSWGGKKESLLYKPSKAIEVAKIVMNRRGREITPEDEELIKAEYERERNDFMQASLKVL